MVKSALRQTNKQKASLTLPASITPGNAGTVAPALWQYAAAWASFVLIALSLPGGLRAPGFLNFQNNHIFHSLAPLELSSTCKLQSDGFTCILYLFYKIFQCHKNSNLNFPKWSDEMASPGLYTISILCF